ncbi:MAG: glutamate synthase large subunit [Cyanobacteria bacterium SZAS TMP-1]|nr:glutamate synthase large subunit [Cyanobacteria bacterium SZAS TMP-1]
MVCHFLLEKLLSKAYSSDADFEKDACGVGFVYRPQNSRRVIDDALTALVRMEHRGACSADGATGDGAGVLTAVPRKLLQAEGYRCDERTAVGMVFMPPGAEAFCREQMQYFLNDEGLSAVAWRPLPLNKDALGPIARSSCPTMEQVLVEGPAAWTAKLLEQKLLFARKRTINHLWSLGEEYSDFYISSLSAQTIVYKGLVRSEQLARFYVDLDNPLYESNYAVYHRRFSTNTMPRWRLAQPFRLIGHNGEINTLLGNRNWMKCREMVLEHPDWDGHGGLHHVVSATTSDSGSLDNALELLVRLGRTPESALMQLVPDPVGGAAHPEVNGFYDYFAGIQEPWDGPALVVYSDGRTVGAKLDRNGMRPARFTRLKDGSVFLASETGVVDFDEAEVVQKGRLGPGQMLSVEIDSGVVRTDLEVKLAESSQYPYSEWVQAERIEAVEFPFASHLKFGAGELLTLQMAYGYGREDVVQILNAMASTGHEAVYSMGDDTPLAVLSSHPRPLFDYFRQRFAQVTNPPIDHLREKLVMSLDTYLGPQTGWFSPNAQAARMVRLKSPVLNEQELAGLSRLGEAFSTRYLPLVFKPSETSLDKALTDLCQAAVEAVQDGQVLLILSDRGVNPQQASIPALMAVGAVHHKLIASGLRLNCSIIVESAQCWTTHHFACLFGFGAQAVCPYLALEVIRHSCAEDSSGSVSALAIERAQANFKIAVEEGLLKVLSKMGISSLASYTGAQIFECIGLGEAVVERCFEGTPSRIGGMEIDDIERDILECHRKAFPFAHKQLINYGMMSSRPGGEYHGNNPKVVKALHTALGISQKKGNVKEPGQENVVNIAERQLRFKEYSELVRQRPPLALRDLLAFASDREPIDIDQVESAESIVKRFCTGGMSLGALSKEAHEVLAIAMNRLGAKSNSGEGGEDPLRYYPIEDVTAQGTSPSFPGLRGLKPGDRASSAVRQVASARFGVTPEYLVTAEQLEIKIAQGAKPGEGGQLPAHKVSAYIAKLRRAKEGMPLISPPPHHDIYSIEDLAQLVFDLRSVNAAAKISVKLVAEVGIGAVGVGVAKANADIIQVSGNDGGTGASALSSIKHAGVPWELGLAEVHRSLLLNGLRKRVLLRVDGGLRSGWEVVMAAMLGADEYGFGSIALIAEGCIMARICHTNNCPVGITSQKEKLREKFTGVPEQIVEFFLYIAEEVRMTLASLGYATIAELLGRSDLLQVKEGVKPFKVEHLNLDYLLAPLPADLTYYGSDPESTADKPEGTWPLGADGYPAVSLSDNPYLTLNDRILAEPEVHYAIANHQAVLKSYSICNTDRSIGAAIGGKLAKLYGDHGFKGKIALRFEGSAGQSFGAFIVDNVRLALTGEANDYVGKGMAGGEIVIKFGENTSIDSHLNVIAGNTCLYGATGGTLYCAGQAGERFAVRNSGSQAVVEGTGDHGCEYMTGGVVVVLGPVGRNFAAGMTGGQVFVLDCDGAFARANYCGEADKRLLPVAPQSATLLRAMIEQHLRATESDRAAEILQNWETYLPQFVHVVPEGELLSLAQDAEEDSQLKIG